MGGKGPPPRPLELTRRLGNPGHRTLPKPGATIAVKPISATPPRGLGLGPEGRRLWRAVATLPWVGASDAAALANACAVADLVALLDADIAAHGPSYEFRGRRMPNPSVGKAVEARKLLSSLLGAFGLTPADRTRLGIAEVKAQSKLDALAARREARAGQAPGSSSAS